MIRDPHAIDGKFTAPETHWPVVVVGAGPAGLSAAIEVAQAGRKVLLIDENPVSASHVGSDVPLWFGGRASAEVQTPARLMEALVASEPLIEAAFEAGVEVLLGTTAWGLFRNRENLASLPAAMLGLADGERAWTIGFDTLILATGARDLALAFPGWEAPGVMGALAFHMLVARYGAFAGRRVAVLGSGGLARQTAALVHEHGLDLAGLVEVRAAPLADGPDAVLVGHTVLGVDAGIEGVTALRLAPTGGGGAVTLACDTVVLAIDAVPAIELAEVGGATVANDPARGGATIPGGAGEVLPGVWLTGGATGAMAPRATIEAQGRAIARRALGLDADLPALPEGFDRMAYRADWLRALVAVSPEDTVVCQCEEVTRADLIGVQPPRYLPRPDKLACRSLGTLLEDGPPDAEQVKRLTRAGMGLCQGRRCREQVSLLLAMGANLAPQQAPRGNWRAPVRPVPLGILADWQESGAMAAGWDVWFGIPTQWIPYQDIGTEAEARHQAALGGNMHL